MKPPTAKGSRGFRILSANVDRRFALLEARPGPLPLSVDEALEAIGRDDFPPLLVMELVTGPEHTVDGICRDGRLVLGHAKTREAMRAGLAMWFETRRPAGPRGRRGPARAGARAGLARRTCSSSGTACSRSTRASRP